MPNTTEIPPPPQAIRPDVEPAPSSSNTPSRWRNAFKIALIVVGVVLVASAILAPTAAKWGINHFLKTEYSSVIALRKLGVNPFTGRVNLSVQKNNQLVLERYGMDWDWLPLFRRTVRLNDIHLKNLTVEIKPLADGGVQIGDIHLEGAAKAVSQAIESGQTHLPIFLDLRNVVLENVSVKYTDPELQATLSFDRIDVRAATLNYGLLKNSGQRLDFTGDVRIAGLVLEPPVVRTKAAREKYAALEKLRGISARVDGLAKISGLYVELATDPKSGRVTPAFRLASLELADNAAIRLQGKGLRPPLDVTFQPVDVQLKNLDSARPADATSLTLATSAGGKSSVRYGLTGTPLAKPFSVAGTGRISRLPLVPFSPLAERFIGYRIQKGTLNLDPNLTVKKGLLDSKWDMGLAKFEVEKVPSAERDPNAEELKVPLESGLLLLKDKNGNIQLEIPLKADLNDPNLAVSALLSRAVSAAVQAGVRASVSKVGAPVSSK